MIGHDTYPRQLFWNHGGRDNERDHGRYAYCNNFNCLSLTLAAGVGPGARRAIRRPSTRSSPVTKLRSTNWAPGTFGAPKGSKGLMPILQEQVRKAGHAIDDWADCHQSIIFPRQMGSYARPRPIRRVPHQASSHGVQADIGDRRQKMQLVHGNRSKPALKEVPRPAPSGIDETGVPPMRFSDRQP